MASNLLIVCFRYKLRILVTFLVCLSVTTGLAFSRKKQYEANASFIVLLGTEYTYRPSAGEQSSVNSALEREQILRTEVEILQNPDLHRSVVRKIGLKRIYPELLRPVGTQHELWSVFNKSTAVLGLNISTESVTDESPTEPIADDLLDLALTEFDAHFVAATVKTGSTVNLSFTHENPQIAAEALNTLSAFYMELRRKLFSNYQSDLVALQVRQLHQQLDDASLRLATFKATNNIVNFANRRDILLREQGEVEQEEQRAAGLISVNTAKIAAFKELRDKVPAENYTSRTAEVETRSAPLRSKAVTQNPVWAAISTDLVRAQGELEGATARLTRAKLQLVEVVGQLQDLGKVEQQLDEFERTRHVAEDNFRSASKVLGERRLVEGIDAQKQTTIRSLQAPLTPNRAKNTRRVILIAGLALSGLLTSIVALLSNYFYPFYLSARMLEQDTGVAVLASIPEIKPAFRSHVARVETPF